VKLPDWMDLQYTGNWEEAIRLKHDSGKEFPAVAGSGKLEAGVYSLLFSSAAISYSQIAEYSLYVDYKATEGLAIGEESRKGQITYWIDYSFNGQELRNVSRVHQTVTLIPETGIRLDDFSFQRITKELKDNNEDHIPDDGTLAEDGKINSYLYISGDKGEMHWKATILDADYEYLYLPVKVANGTIGVGTGYNVNLLKDQLSLTIGGVSVPNEKVTVHTEGSDYAYLVLEDKAKQYLKSGKLVNLFLPFEDCLMDSSKSLVFNAECFVSHNPVSDVKGSFENSDRKGRDKIQRNVRFVHLAPLLYWPAGSQTQTFAKEGILTINAGIQAVLYSNLPSPYFVNEVRRHAYPYQMIWELPEGYEFDEMSVTVAH